MEKLSLSMINLGRCKLWQSNVIASLQLVETTRFKAAAAR
jgi:hypothetical protein